MHVAKHAEAYCFLVTVENSSESLSVLMTTFIRNVTDKNGIPPFLLKFHQVFFYELQLRIRVGKLIPKHLVVEVTALCVQRNNPCLQLGKVLDIITVLVPTRPFFARNPLAQAFSARKRWSICCKVPLGVRESVVISNCDSKIQSLKFSRNDVDYSLQLSIDFILGFEREIVRDVISSQEQIVSF